MVEGIKGRIGIGMSRGRFGLNILYVCKDILKGEGDLRR